MTNFNDIRSDEFVLADNVSTTAVPSGDGGSDEGMLRALVMTFSIIGFGYFAAKFSWLPPPNLGLAQFVGRVGLPSVVFRCYCYNRCLYAQLVSRWIDRAGKDDCVLSGDGHKFAHESKEKRSVCDRWDSWNLCHNVE